MPFKVFHRSIGQYDSVPDRVASFFAQCALNFCVQPVAVVRVDALGHGFATRNTLSLIKPPDAVSLLRPIEDRRLVVGRHTDVSQPLCFAQIGLTAAQPIFGLLAFLDINSQAIPLNDASLLIAQWLATSMVPTKLAVRPTQTHHTLVRSSGLNCVIV